MSKKDEVTMKPGQIFKKNDEKMKIEHGFTKEIIELWTIYLNKLEILNEGERSQFVIFMQLIHNPIFVYNPDKEIS